MQAHTCARLPPHDGFAVAGRRQSQAQRALQLGRQCILARREGRRLEHCVYTITTDQTVEHGACAMTVTVAGIGVEALLQLGELSVDCSVALLQVLLRQQRVTQHELWYRVVELRYVHSGTSVGDRAKVFAVRDRVATGAQLLDEVLAAGPAQPPRGRGEAHHGM